MELSKEIEEKLDSVTKKRARIVIQHIKKNGFITTEQLNQVYHYEHAPRAIRDVREEGIPIIMRRVKSADGKSIAEYRFGDLSKIDAKKKGGRIAFSKAQKIEIYKEFHGKCSICNGSYPMRYFQVDHCVPYEIAGESSTKFQLICPSCNRAKSWSCEHCGNWKNKKNPKVCEKCLWASPTKYEHVAETPERRVTVIWQGDEVAKYDSCHLPSGDELPTLIKTLLEKKAK